MSVDAGSRGRGVLRPVARKQPAVASRQLKFGVDRILSPDISPAAARVPEAWACPPPPDLGSARGAELPCAECVGSLLRCCRLSSEPCYAGYYATLHAPRPLRPFTSLVGSEAPRGGAEPPGPGAKRRRSWSRAVFSNLQRKGLEKRFQLQKYITKPDRRQLAATLGLTDAQVKVWFQNRRMKWRHSKEGKHAPADAGQARDEAGRPDSTQGEELIDVHTVDS
ncbi:H2.0-like homeobox protein [Bacillus rossius redtenbacheri]|uniref:H2.0-like homeobox protein n=1 Tax=Bacillus rossius redtenbacheri TaxID=93214 RepID=UPI002FDE918B